MWHIRVITAVVIVATVFGQNDLRTSSSRFRSLASSTWGQGQQGQQPVVIRLQPSDQPQTGADQSGIPSLLGNNPQPRAPVAQGVSPPQVPPTAQVNSQPQPPTPAAVAPQPLRIPPQIAEILGIQNLGIPGLLETSPPAPPTGFDPATLATNLQNNPTWAELAAQNPDLLRQLQTDGLANQPVLSSIQGLPQSNQPLQNAQQLLATQQALSQQLGMTPKQTMATLEQSFPGITQAALPGGDQTTGLLSILGTLTQRLTQASGVRDILSQAGPALQGSLGGGAPPGAQFSSGGPPVAGLPRLPSLPGVPLLPGGLPRDASGQIDYVRLMSAVTQRVTNGTTLSDVLPPTQLQKLADNITDVLLPDTPDVDLTKFMGRWFEGINSPRASEQRCIVHHYGGLTDNGKTATFTALKIYREGSEFGQVRYSIGYAFRGGHHMGMLQMHSSESTDPAPYWIYRVGPEAPDAFGNNQYEYAIVSNWVKYPVTVLVRDPDTFKRKYEQDVLRYLEDNGFINGFIRAFNMLQPVSYENCQYSDSTFQVFGK